MTLALTRQADTSPEPGAVLTRAVIRAADKLGLKSKTLSTMLGVSEATVSRMKRGNHVLESGTKPFELAVLVVRLYRSLDGIAGGDEKTVRAWMERPNTVLGDNPVNMVQTIAGLTDVIAYLDARRAQV